MGTIQPGDRHNLNLAEIRKVRPGTITFKQGNQVVRELVVCRECCNESARVRLTS